MGKDIRKIIIATKNPGKLKEFKEILGNRFEIIALPYNGYEGGEEETGKTFFENALLKAKAAYEKTGVMSLGDDSGLCINALHGAPGLFSSRFGGENLSWPEKIKLLIKSLDGFDDKSAEFVCTLVLYGRNEKNGSPEVIAAGEGRTKGRIAIIPRGENGFGYDPVFYSDELKKTFGEASKKEKNGVSHRARAAEALLRNL